MYFLIINCLYRYISDNINRNGQIENGYFKPKIEDANDIQAWGLGAVIGGNTGHGSSATSHNFNPFVAEQPRFDRFCFLYIHPSSYFFDYSLVINKSRLNGNGPNYVAHQKSTPSMTAAQIAAQYDPQINQQNVSMSTPRPPSPTSVYISKT